jgi:hypothetical protein
MPAWRRNRIVAEANRFSGIPIRTRSGTRMYGRFRKRAKPVAGVVPATYPAAKTVAWHCGMARVSDGFRKIRRNTRAKYFRGSGRCR